MTENELIRELESDLKKAFELIRCQKTEIDILIRKKETLRDEIADLQHKIKVLEGENLVFKGGVEYFKSEAIKEILSALETSIEESDKYIREYEDSKEQRAYNKALRDAHNLVKEMVGDTDV